MKHIYVNLKRFDIPARYGGVNRLATSKDWGPFLVKETQIKLKEFAGKDVEFVQFFPEAHLISASEALEEGSLLRVGCQSVYRMDTQIGGNFGAFTGNRTANSMKALGINDTIIGHCEERIDKKGVLAEAGIKDASAVNRLLNKEVRLATESGMRVLYCIGETEEEQPEWERILEEQLMAGLDGVDTSKVVIGYEPVWSIGPGKTPADKKYISKIAKFVKKTINGIDVVYGGGLKSGNARMLASIDEIDGGLIALTRFSGEIGFYPDEYIDIIKKYLA